MDIYDLRRFLILAKNPADFGNNYAVQDGVTTLFFTPDMNLGGIYIDKMLREEDVEERRKLLIAAAECLNEDPPTSFDYLDMSPQALCGPPLALIAFAGIAVRVYGACYSDGDGLSYSFSTN